MEGIGHYTYEIIRHLSSQHPADQFILCVDHRRACTFFRFDDNVTFNVIRPPARHPLLFLWWFEVGIPYAYKKNKADLLFSPDGFLSLHRAVTKTLLVIHDLAYFHYPKHVGPAMLWYYRVFTPKYIEKADHIIAVSRYTRDDLIKNFRSAKGKSTSIYNGLRYLPGKRQFSHDISTSEKPYFLYYGSLHPRKNVEGLIKAFELFKNQRDPDDNTKLVIVGRKAWKVKGLESAIVKHRFASDILLKGHISDEHLSGILKNCIALVYVSFFEGFGLPVLEAMANGVPVVTTRDSAMAEIGGSAAVLVDPEDPSNIAKGMRTIVEDSNLRKRCIEAGLARAHQFDWSKSAEKVWEIMQSI